MSSSSMGSPDRSGYASPHRWSSYAARASSRTRVTWSVSPTARGPSREERLGRLTQRPDEHPHLCDLIVVEPVHERIAGFERLAVAAESGVFPFRGPAVGPDAELL